MLSIASSHLLNSTFHMAMLPIASTNAISDTTTLQQCLHKEYKWLAQFIMDTLAPCQPRNTDPSATVRTPSLLQLARGGTSPSRAGLHIHLDTTKKLPGHRLPAIVYAQAVMDSAFNCSTDPIQMKSHCYTVAHIYGNKQIPPIVSNDI